MNKINVSRQAGYYSVYIGNIMIRVLSDGTTDMDMYEILVNIQAEELENLLFKSFLSNTVIGSINIYLIQIEGKLILIDTGSGDLLDDNSGYLLESLEAVGYTPGDIDIILLTHIHSDHSGGLTKGDVRIFPNAVVYVNKLDFDFWLSEENRIKEKPMHHDNFKYAKIKIEPYLHAGKLKTFEGQTKLFPGLSALPAPGHTPGHTYYVLEDAGEKLVICGDIAHVPAIQFALPHVSSIYDIDPDQAGQARKEALAEAANGRYWIATSHASFPGIGHIAVNGQGYSWVPIQYSNDGTGQ
jgi:glyoxylase-like metal-dependent hydrolase (beta-lactamase superfamily II)